MSTYRNHAASLAQVRRGQDGLRRPVPGPARAVDQKAWLFQVDQVGGGLLERRRAPAAASAHLRHRLGVAAGPRRSTSSGCRRRSGVTTAGSAPSSTFSISRPRSAAGLAVFHPKGGLVRKMMEDYSRAGARARRLRVRLHASSGEVDPFRDFGPSAMVRRGHVPAHGDGGRDLLPKADELPDAHPRSTRAASVLTGSSRCGSSSSGPSTASSAPACSTACCGCGA